MRKSSTPQVGLDFHEDSIGIAVADEPWVAEVRHLGMGADSVDAVTMSQRKLVSAGHRLCVVYEGASAGSCCSGIGNRPLVTSGCYSGIGPPWFNNDLPLTTPGPAAHTRCTPGSCTATIQIKRVPHQMCA